MSLIVSQSLSDTDLLILQYNIYDENNPNNPVNLWMTGSLQGKVSQCYKRMQAEWIPKLIADNNVLAISASRDDFVEQVTGQPSYQNRYTRESASLS